MLYVGICAISNRKHFYVKHNPGYLVVNFSFNYNICSARILCALGKLNLLKYIFLFTKKNRNILLCCICVFFLGMGGGSLQNYAKGLQKEPTLLYNFFDDGKFENKSGSNSSSNFKIYPNEYLTKIYS